MKDILTSLLALNLVLKIQKYGFQCQITVSTDDYKFFAQQLLPKDDHLEYALEGCIKFCIDKCLERKKGESNLANEGFYS